MTFFVSFYKSKPLKTLSTHFAYQVTHPDFPLRFPKTKKSLMNEWLNETVEPVTPAGGAVGVGYLGVGEGVPTCYMRSPIASSATRRLSAAAASAALTAGAPAATPPPPPQDAIGSAKKRWLRQAISEEHQQPDGGAAARGGDLSPSSRPDSPGGGSAVLDYITPLKKRRLARESLSSEQSNDGGTKL